MGSIWTVMWEEGGHALHLPNANGRKEADAPTAAYELDGPSHVNTWQGHRGRHEKRRPQHLWTSQIRTKVPLCTAQCTHAPWTCFVLPSFSFSHKKLRFLLKYWEILVLFHLFYSNVASPIFVCSMICLDQKAGKYFSIKLCYFLCL